MTEKEKSFIKKVIRTVRATKEIGVILTVKDKDNEERHAYICKYGDGHIFGTCWKGNNDPLALVSKKGREWEITYDPNPNNEAEIVTVNMSNL